MRQPHGQNFLVDLNIARKITDAGLASSPHPVIEIGPGKGVLTALIAEAHRPVTAIEIDARLVDGLTRKFARMPDVRIVNLDFLISPLPESPFCVIANLPYDAGTAIISRLVAHASWDTAVVMLQKEVARRIAAGPGTKEYGALTVHTGYYAKAEMLFLVGPGSFNPPPKVESAVIRLTNKRPAAPDPLLFDVVRAAFSQRRKTALNALSHYFNAPKTSIAEALADAALPQDIRAECIELNGYLLLTECLKKRYNFTSLSEDK